MMKNLQILEIVIMLTLMLELLSEIETIKSFSYMVVFMVNII